MNKPTIPFHWTPVMEALFGRKEQAQHLTLLYVMTGAFPVDAHGRELKREDATDSTTWLVVWPVEEIARLSGTDRDAAWWLRKKLAQAGLAKVRTPYDRKARIAEVWDVTPLVQLTPQDVAKVASEVRAKLSGAPVRRVRKPKAVAAPESAVLKPSRVSIPVPAPVATPTPSNNTDDFVPVMPQGLTLDQQWRWKRATSTEWEWLLKWNAQTLEREGANACSDWYPAYLDAKNRGDVAPPVAHSFTEAEVAGLWALTKLVARPAERVAA